MFSFEPALTRKVTELTEYVVVDDEEYEVLVWEIELRVGEDFILCNRKYVRTADVEVKYSIKYRMVYNEEVPSEEDAIQSFNRWVYQILKEKVFKSV